MLPILVKIEVAEIQLKKSGPQILALADGGSVAEPGLMWVWNLARNPSGYRRCLRFWLPELQARAQGNPARYHRESLKWVLAQILTTNRRTFNAGDVDSLLQIRHRTRLDYGTQLPGKLGWPGSIYQRAAMETFLKRRWLGAEITKTQNRATRATRAAVARTLPSAGISLPPPSGRLNTF